jgi:RNA polymerase sigma-B factor
MLSQTPSLSGNATRLANSNEVQALLTEYARTRDSKLRDRLVALHERTVRYLASRFRADSCTSLEDLVQVGYLGLIVAIERYDPERGVSFLAFATPTILGELKRYLRDHTWRVKPPRRLRELGLTLRKLHAEMEQRLGRAPSVVEMAEAAGLTEERLIEAMDLEYLYRTVSLDVSLYERDGEEKSAWDVIGGPDPHLSLVEDRETLRCALQCLDARQQRIIEYRFFEQLSQLEVARRLGLSQMHVSRLERDALRRMHTFLS